MNNIKVIHHTCGMHIPCEACDEIFEKKRNAQKALEKYLKDISLSHPPIGGVQLARALQLFRETL